MEWMIGLRARAPASFLPGILYRFLEMFKGGWLGGIRRICIPLMFKFFYLSPKGSHLFLQFHKLSVFFLQLSLERFQIILVFCYVFL
jgi:hypothetical protein